MSGVLHLERIESSVGTGFPDVSVAGGGKQFLIETKVSKIGEGKEWLYFERFQLSFYAKRLRFTDDRGIYVIALCQNEIKFWHAKDLIDSPREPYKKWNRILLNTALEPFITLTKPWGVRDMEISALRMIKET